VLAQEPILTLTRRIESTQTEVFRAFTNTASLRDWLCNAAQVDVRTGGRIYLWWNNGYFTSGAFTNIERYDSLSFTWQGPGESISEVHVSIDAEGNSTEVTVAHSGLLASETAGTIGKLWETALENLQTLLETGNDLRLLRRPMFGLNGAEEMTPELAKQTGSPVSEGLRLGGVLPGMGAEAAGLQKDDIVTNLAGHETPNFAAFVAAIEPHLAGDRVPVTFYRGSEKHTVDMVLSSRPAPVIPTSIKAMADTAREVYMTLDKEMDALFEGVSEEAAERRPAPGAWNAKEVMAHLISVERDNQTWIAAITEDFDIEQPFHSNGRERIEAIVSAYPTIPILIEEMKRNEAMTVAMAAALSEETQAHKHLVNQIATSFTTFDTHHREHFAEIQKLLSTPEA
jgi:uncharacterized protein YndB with AHSA1/START domain